MPKENEEEEDFLLAQLFSICCIVFSFQFEIITGVHIVTGKEKGAYLSDSKIRQMSFFLCLNILPSY